jgi:hypothetical protein
MITTHDHGIALRSWVRSTLFRAYLRRFVLLWMAGKVANAGTAILAGLPPLSFRPLTEIGICAIQLGLLSLFIRQTNEDILLGNLGLPVYAALAPMIPVHFALSALVLLLR